MFYESQRYQLKGKESVNCWDLPKIKKVIFLIKKSLNREPVSNLVKRKGTFIQNKTLKSKR